MRSSDPAERLMKAMRVLGPHLQRMPIRREIPSDLTLGTAQALMEVMLGDGQLTVGDVASHLGLPLPRTSKLLGELEGLGLIERTRDSADRRRVTVRTSRAGSRAAGALRVSHRARLSRLLEVVGAHDTEQLLGILERAANRLETSARTSREASVGETGS
jgi:DNA-binding MarR family transcriptional regulator